MIDFHSHILPEIDDGSKSYEESIKMLNEAKEVGFNKVISTSHYAVNCYEVPEYKRKELLEELMQEQNMPELLLGSEIFLTYNIVDLLEEYKASTINGTKYILIELPLREHFFNLKDILYRLKEKDYKIILAHPERYSMVHKNFNILYELSDLGILFQANYGSILGIYGMAAKSTIKKMLKNNLVTFLGTDAHRENSIYPKIPKAITKIQKFTSEDELEELTTTNAERILDGEIL